MKRLLLVLLFALLVPGSIECQTPPQVYIFGQVAKPGSYPLGSSMTVVKLIERAGGFTELAKTEKVTIVRGATVEKADEHLRITGGIRFPFNHKNFIEGKEPEQNINLKNGDVVVVP